MKLNKKLIEVALPLEAINIASAHEKMPGIGPHPRGIHLWWARRPLAAARAVIFAQMVDDPSTYVDVLKSDAKLKRVAMSTLKARMKVWEEAQALSEKSRDTTVFIPGPGNAPTLDETLADIERERLFSIIKELVKWENTTNELVIEAAQNEIWQSWRRTCAENSDHENAKLIFNRTCLPSFHDPFSGGGALPLEAQRLGLESHASDLNPVAVLINKAMIEIPPRFNGNPPVNSGWQSKSISERAMTTNWAGTLGLSDDLKFYGKWMRDEAEKRIGNLFPKVPITDEMLKKRPDLQKYLGKNLTVIAWIWSRTVKSPNPAFSHVDVPLASTFVLSTKSGKEVFVKPLINSDGYIFEVRAEKPDSDSKTGTKISRGANFKCLMSDTPISSDYIKSEGRAGRMGARLMAVVVAGDRSRIYLSPTKEMQDVAESAIPKWIPDTPLPADMRSHWTPPYGLSTYGDLFTNRQLVALGTFSDLVTEARDLVKHDAVKSGLQSDGIPLYKGGKGADAYADALSVYLSFGVDRITDFLNSLCGWSSSNQKVMHLFGKQSLPMVWDYAEANCLENVVGGLFPAIDFIADCLGKLPSKGVGFASQQDAMSSLITVNKVVSTDPPYYDNIGYADLSDFFYVFLRRNLRNIYPDIFSTVAVPKDEELVATPYRHGGKDKAESFFLNGMTQAMSRLAEQAHPAFPVTIYYAFKQAESDDKEGTTNTGWDTFLEAVIQAGFAITGTWPMRSEQEYRMIGMGANALASSIVLVCRKKLVDAPNATRREFISLLKAELPKALAHLQAGNIAPVDLAQAAIGPGMAVYTRFAKVLDSEGNAIAVRAALSLINQTLDEALASQEGDFDADTRWALTWFEQVGFGEGDFGIAEQLSKSKNTAINGLVESGILLSKGGKVRLLKPSEFDVEWKPDQDKRLTVWEIVHQLIRVLEASGESEASNLVAQLGAKSDIARELCYRLYTLCERKKRASEAMSYNGLVQSWPEISRLASSKANISGHITNELFEQE
jgi:putative DNA methylase